MNRVIAGSALGAALVLAACGRNAGTAQAPTALPSVHVASALIVSHPIPPLDLQVAGLAGVADLVTPFQFSSTDNGRTLTLIGAYADTARTVLLFRENPDLGLPNVRVNDDQGFVDAGGSAGPVHAPGFRGDYYVALDEGAHPGADGVAHLAITVSNLQRWTPAGGIVEGNWAFNIAITVQPGHALAAAPNQFRLGAWKVTIERLELTPAVVRLQTLVNGASPVMLGGPGNATFVELVDSAGNPVRELGGGAGITVPKQQVNPVNYLNSRTRDEWLRPAAGTYRLRFQGSGGRFEIPIVIGA
ncbi:MAG: hypothetical protein M3Z28_07155 [Candidatus Dormibacteraeota bacterium]|nr:hypothetical protein [Candidatus Dormibacteraeota bacterium]